jgi:hypothetical protein
MVKIDFEFKTKYGKFADALWFQDNQLIPSAAEIEVLKQQRLDNWIAAITAPPVEELPVEISQEI